MSDPPLPNHNQKLYKVLRGHIRVDQMRLADELLESADLVMTCAEHCAEAMAIRDMKAADVKVTTAQRASVLRRRIVNGKARSETEIKSLLEGDKEVVEASNEYEAARFDAALWAALVNAAQLKHSALKRGAEMMVSGYLTTTSITGEGRKKLNEERQRRRRENADDT